jgi:hypothetical protein
MTAPALAAIISRELRALERELLAYPSDESVWALPAGLPNSAGTLALHAAGNLLHFVGAVLGEIPYVRDRDGEFSRRGVSRMELVAGLREADAAVQGVLPSLSPERMAAAYPLAVANRRVETGDFLLHLATHLAYHLGQVDYHRRVVTGDVAGVGAVAPLELSSARPIQTAPAG